MSFLDIIDRAKTYLERHHRMSLRVLRREFDLDDEAVEELVEELVEIQRVATRDGKALVWIGPTAAAPVAETTARPEPTGEAERRQLTVMFCDLVGSTALSERLDPEEMREVVQAHRAACVEVIDRFGGHLAKYLGDGLLVHFGYPVAHEDDAERAVRAGLALVEATQQLNSPLEEKHGVSLSIRVGIHTGLVVAGEMGAGTQREELGIIGQTPNIAARLEGVAEPDTVVFSATTLRLVPGIFVTEDMGTPPLKGVSEPLRVYRVIQPSGVRSRLDVAAGRLTPFVGRQEEVGLLLGRWEQVEDKLGQVVHISAEAGLGKSRLVQVFRERLAETPHTWLECRCSPYDRDSAFHPVLELVQQGLTFTDQDSPQEKLFKLERGLELAGLPLAETVPLLGTLLALPIPDSYPPLAVGGATQRQKTLEALIAWTVALGERQPLVMLYEDLHWCDPSTLELLRLSVEQVSTSRILLVLTSRPEFLPEWKARAHHAPIVLNRLSGRQARAMVAGLASERQLPHEVIDQIASRADGMPLFLEELTRMVLESGMLDERDGRYELNKPVSDLAIPTTLQDSLTARLDRLSAAKEVAQLAATVGREFPYALIEAVSPSDEPTLRQGLAAVVDAEILHQKGVPPRSTYVFKHNLVQKAAYESLLKSTRRAYHAKIAEVLAQRFPQITESQPELSAHHLTEAGRIREAVDEWQRAGVEAERRLANAECVSHLKRATELLLTLPETPERDLKELELQLAIGMPMMISKGYANPEAELAYGRARTLCGRIGPSRELYMALLGLGLFHQLRGDLEDAYTLDLQLIELAELGGDAVGLAVAHARFVNTLIFAGDLPGTLKHGNLAIEFHRSWERQDSDATGAVIAARLEMGRARWLLGYPDRAVEEMQEAMELAFEEPVSIFRAYALTWTGLVHYCRGEFELARDLARKAIAISSDYGFPLWTFVAEMLHGYALRKLNLEPSPRETGVKSAFASAAMTILGLDVGDAVPSSEEFMRAYGEKENNNVNTGLWFAVGLEAHQPVGSPESYCAIVDHLLSSLAKNGEHVWDAELHRHKGTLLLQSDNGSEMEAEGCFRRALEVARAQQAKSLELRAATSLARLQRDRGRNPAARETLAPVYEWFTEGFDTQDLKAAKKLLEELS